MTTTLTTNEQVAAGFIARHHRHLGVTLESIPEWCQRVTDLVDAYLDFPGTTEEKQAQNALIKGRVFYEDFLEPRHPGKRDYWTATLAAVLVHSLNSQPPC